MQHLKLLASASDISEEDWRRLDASGDPFVSSAFLVAAERCVTARGPLGWQAQHLSLYDGAGRLAGLLPMYQRHHWYGDFASDYGWGPAWQQAGLSYFPKLVSGVPFTPSPGPRILVAEDNPDTRIALIAAAIQMTVETGASNWQCLFVREHDRSALESAGLLLRRGVQFHWLDRGYRDFADFLSTFSAEKRKKLKRERRAVIDAGLHIEVRHADQIEDTLWPAIHRHYRSTFERLGGYAAFSLDFFCTVARELGRKMVVFCAFEGENPVASAICYRDDIALYGRHWGADIDCPGLHFELCYYTGIEYAITHGLRRFEPGAQGEHKVARGFEPVSTWSAYWITNPRMRIALTNYIAREEVAMLDYMNEMAGHLPYKVSEKMTG